MVISTVRKLLLFGSLLLPRAASLSTKSISPRAISLPSTSPIEMDESLRQQLRAAGSRESLEYTQQFKLPFGDAYVDASVCCGAGARPFSGVANQPKIFPSGSFLQLPKEVDSHAKANDFIKRNLPGCEVKLSGGIKSSGARLQSWTLACKCHRIAKKLDPADFKEGCVARKGTKRESVKRCDYDHMGGCIVGAMEVKGKKKRKRQSKSGKSESTSSTTEKKISKQPETNRTGSHGAKDASTRCVHTFILLAHFHWLGPRLKRFPVLINVRCMMKVHIFQHAGDDRYYVRSDSNLTHRGHPYLAPSDVNKSSSELTADDLELIELLNGKIGPQSIANIINERHDGEGEFLSSTIYSKVRELQRVKDLEKGILSDMSVAEKTIKDLEQ